MGERSGIEWTTATWNPVIGCQKVSPACTNCYAEQYAAQRLSRPELWRGERYLTTSTWGEPERVDRKAGREGRRAQLFVSSLSDVFEDHPVWEPIRHPALNKLRALVNTDVLLLTKRPGNIRRMVPAAWLDDWPEHVWTGTTVEDQQRADERLPELFAVPGPHFLSMEPLLGPVTLDLRARWHGGCAGGCLDDDLYLSGDGAERCRRCGWPQSGGLAPPIQWVIAGGESGRGARPSHPDWFRSVRDQCWNAGIPFMFKQWGDWIPRSHTTARSPWHDERTPDRVPSWRVPGPPTLSLCAADGWGTIGPERFHLATTPFNGHDDDGHGEAIMHRVGKKHAGRMLDGVLHDGRPESFGVPHA